MNESLEIISKRFTLNESSSGEFKEDNHCMHPLGIQETYLMCIFWRVSENRIKVITDLIDSSCFINIESQTLIILNLFLFKKMKILEISKL